jgi:hypothetical protein
MSNTSFLQVQQEYENMIASYATLLGNNSSLDDALSVVNQKLKLYQESNTAAAILASISSITSASLAAANTGRPPDQAVTEYSANQAVATAALAQTETNTQILQARPSSSEIQGAFSPISDYYLKLSSSISSLQNYINTAAKNINNSTPRLLNEERYTNSIHPEQSMEAREASWSFFPELRMSSFPYLISASVFMASLSIILIFNMYGFSGQVNIPVSITQILSLFNSPASSVPFYQKPMFLGGIAVILLISTASFGFLYYKAKNTNSS